MSPKPTGHVHGNDLILTRTFRAPIDDVWSSVTKSESTARWFGRWEGEAGPGKLVRLQLVHEKGQPWTNVMIEECEAPRRLVVSMKDEHGEWRIGLTLTQMDDVTELRFVQHLSDRNLAGDVGPGWEYYLDMLVAARRQGAAVIRGLLPVTEGALPGRRIDAAAAADRSRQPSSSRDRLPAPMHNCAPGRGNGG